MTDYYVDGAVGDDGNAGTSEGSGNAWATPDHAANTISEGDRVFVKASVTYSEEVTLATAGTVSAGIAFIGYGTTVGDNQKVTISGGGSRTTCVTLSGGTGDVCTLFANFIFDNAAGDCFATGGGDAVVFYNCSFTNAGDRGFQGDNKHVLVKCTFADNTNSCLDSDANTHLIACSLDANGADGAIISDGSVIHTEIFNVGANSDALVVNGTVPTVLVNATLDGENLTGTVGVDFSHASMDIVAVVNTIIHDFATGIDIAANINNVFMFANSIMSSVTTEYAGNTARFEPNKSTSAPGFTDESNRDYTITASSAADDTGLDASDA